VVVALWFQWGRKQRAESGKQNGALDKLALIAPHVTACVAMFAPPKSKVLCAIPSHYDGEVDVDEDVDVDVDEDVNVPVSVPRNR